MSLAGLRLSRRGLKLRLGRQPKLPSGPWRILSVILGIILTLSSEFFWVLL